MLSAVGTHLGPGRAYSHPFAGPTSVPPALLPPNSLNNLPPAINLTGMSTEFARPHPKQPRYNGGPMRNSTNIGGPKFSEQSSPVNLVTNSTISQSSIQHSAKEDRLESHQVQNKQDGHSTTSNSLYSSRIPYVTGSTIVSNAYREIDYSSIYGRGAIYANPGLYSAHALAARGQMHRNAYMPQIEPYSSYLQTFNPPNSLGILVPPQVPVATTVISSTASIQSGINDMIISKPQILNNENHSRHQSAPILGNTEKLEKDIKERSSSASTASTKSVGFKVPSGKEGSMKHRILKGPYGDKEVRRKSPNNLEKVTLVRPTTNNNLPTNFSKGQLVEVAHGELKRIEDLRTEDFIMASEKTQNLKVIDTTVVKVTAGSNNVAVTLMYGNHRKKVEMQVNPEQPFYVYGQGWASCDPEASMQIYGLKCQQLQVGDVCISVYTQNPQIHQQISPAGCVSQIVNSQQHQVQHFPSTSVQQNQQHQIPPPPVSSQPYFHYPYYREDVLQLPQNLSRRSNTIPTTATGTAVTSRPVSHIEQMQPHQSISSISYSSHSTDKLLNSNHISAVIRNSTDNERRQTSNIIIHSPYESTGSRSITHDNNSLYINEPRATSSAPSAYIPRSSQNDHSAVSMIVSKNNDDDQLEVTNSRKRRWSAPDNGCDDESCHTKH